MASIATARHMNDAVFRYMEQFTTEIVSESGNPADKNHLGKFLLKGLREHQDAVNQIDGGTGESETNGSVLVRSTLLASCLRQFGLRRGDVIALMAPSHLDLCVPFYAALYLGVIVMAVDRTLKPRELRTTFEIGKPKIIFCQSEKAADIQLALDEMDVNSQIVTFDRGSLCSLSDFIKKYEDQGHSTKTFRASEFDGSDTTAFLILTSGTTGPPKAVTMTHEKFAIIGPCMWCKHTQFPTPTARALVCAPLQWMTALTNFLWGPILTYTRVQSSSPVNQQHCYELINKYRPTWTVLNPNMLTILLKMPDRLQCDFTSFETILLGGSAVSAELVEAVKTVTDAEVSNVFAMSEVGMVFMPDGAPPPGSCGKPLRGLQYRLISLETGEEILKPMTPGELWLRGPAIFKEYYNNPEATEEAFSDGGWFRTGDMFYRDSSDNYFYVDRIKLLLKYKSYQISPVELENVIRLHEDVVDVAVTGVPDPECGDLVVACVVRRADSHLTAQHVKHLVKDNLSEPMQLRGGVLFLEALPIMATTKLDRRRLKEIAASTPRE